MTSGAIYQKYWSALVDVDAVMVPQDAAIALALRLAIGDAYAAGSALADDLVAIVASQQQPERFPADQRYAEQLHLQINRINEWLAEEEPALYRDPNTDTAGAVLDAIRRRDIDLTNAYHDLQAAAGEANGLRQQLAQMDADNADLLNKVHQAQVEIDRLTRQNAIAVDTFNSLHTNGNGVDPTPAAQSPDWGRNHPAWQALPAAALAVIDQLSSGQIKFRSLGKTLRRDLVLRAIRHLASEHGGTASSSTWDRERPPWLPTQGAVIMLSDGGNWHSLLAMALVTATA